MTQKIILREVSREDLPVFFLQQQNVEAVRMAADNIASIRVLQICGFTVIGQSRGFAATRVEEINEWVLVRSE